jgi:hypothetical protein
MAQRGKVMEDEGILTKIHGGGLILYILVEHHRRDRFKMKFAVKAKRKGRYAWAFPRAYPLLWPKNAIERTSATHPV